MEKAGSTLGEWFIRQPGDPYAGYSIKWDGEWQVTYETFRDMGTAYAVGLILIYLLVVAHFKSYLVPLIIMADVYKRQALSLRQLRLGETSAGGEIDVLAGLSIGERVVLDPLNAAFALKSAPASRK